MCEWLWPVATSRCSCGTTYSSQSQSPILSARNSRSTFFFFFFNVTVYYNPLLLIVCSLPLRTFSLKVFLSFKVIFFLLLWLNPSLRLKVFYWDIESYFFLPFQSFLIFVSPFFFPFHEEMKPFLSSLYSFAGFQEVLPHISCSHWLSTSCPSVPEVKPVFFFCEQHISHTRTLIVLYK